MFTRIWAGRREMSEKTVYQKHVLIEVGRLKGCWKQVSLEEEIIDIALDYFVDPAKVLNLDTTQLDA